MSASATSSASFLNNACVAAHVERPSRLALLDTTRVIAAMGIVWIHAAVSPAGKAFSPLGTFGVPFYTFIAILFMARSLSRDEGRSLTQYIGSRFVRIYIPFLFWSLAYLALGNFKLILAHEPTDWLDPTVLYSGDEEHLWFLPFLMVVTIFGAVVYRVLEHRRAARTTVAVLLILAGAVACVVKEPGWITRRTDDYFFFHYAFRALPTVCWSIALALLTVYAGKLPKSSPRLAIGGLCLLVAALLLDPKWSTPPVLRSLAGLGCLLVALCPLTSPLVSRIGSMGKHSYGIYLSHIAFLRLMMMVTDRLHFRTSITTDLLSFAIAFIAASILSVALGRSKWTRWTIGE